MSTDSRAARWHRRALRALNAGDLEAAAQACTKVLGLDPEHADATFILATCDLQRDKPGEALPRFVKATTLESGRADYWAQYARCLVRLGRSDEARTAVQRARLAQPDDALTHDTLGTVLTLTGDYRSATAEFSAATKLSPDNVQFQYNHATGLLFCGEIEKAERAFERTVELDPHHVLAHLALAENFTSQGRPDRIERLEATLSRVRGNVDDELVIHQCLARELEAGGRTESAFRHFEQGRSGKKQAAGYTIEDDRRIFSAIEDLFQPATLASLEPGRGSDSAAPIFVLGMPRTGTTLVERILSSHSSVSSGGELISLPQSVWEAGGSHGRLINPETWPQALATDPLKIGERYLEHAASLVEAAARFVDKRPLNYYLIGFIRRALPQAKIVCLRRGALDTCIANFRHLFALQFAGYRYALSLEDTAEYFALFERLMVHWDELYPGAILHVRYENLVRDFDVESRRLLDYLELPYEDSVGRFHENSAPVATASAVQVRQPLYQSSIGAWRRYEAQLGPLKRRLAELGVDLADEG